MLRGLHRTRRLAVAVCLAVVAAGQGPGWADGGSPTPGSPPVAAALTTSLRGSGTWDVSPEMAAWATSAGASTSLTYTPAGDAEGMNDLVSGAADFVVSGLPPTREQSAQLSATGRGVLAIPLQPSALAFVLRVPGAGLNYSVMTNATEATTTALPAQLRVPAPVLAEVVLGSGQNPWADPTFMDANDIPAPTKSVPARNTAVVDAVPGEGVLRLKDYLRTANPGLWSQWLQGAGVTESAATSWPAAPGAEPVVGPDAVIAALGADGGPGGIVAAVPPWALARARAAMPQADLRAFELTSGTGRWVGPLPQAITAGAAGATGATGAYPLSWLDSLYVAPHGLGADKINALALLLRRAVTTGRADSLASGDATLTDALAAQALDGVNQLVSQGCTDPGFAVTAVDQGGPGASALMCRPVAPVAAPGPPPPAVPSAITAPALPPAAAPASATVTVTAAPVSQTAGARFLAEPTVRLTTIGPVRVSAGVTQDAQVPVPGPVQAPPDPVGAAAGPPARPDRQDLVVVRRTVPSGFPLSGVGALIACLLLAIVMLCRANRGTRTIPMWRR